VDLIVADRKLSLGRGEADIALRAGPQPETSGVAARRICGLGWTVYGTPAYAARHGLPRGLGDLAGHAVMGGEGRIAEAAALRLLEEMPGVEVVSRSDSLTNIAAAVAAGLCLSALPCLIGDRLRLLRCFAPPPELAGEFWLVVREELRQDRHVRAFLDALVAHLQPLRPMLEGAAVASIAEPA
jgi:DNA-binding transcriptional LysR family regulator